MNRLILVLVLLCNPVHAIEQTLIAPQQSAQFISYWKSHVVTSQQDERIALAEKVYARLLRAWDNSRLVPGLYVVDSDSGPWAASLVDGNILLSLKALDTINSFGQQRAEHLLAFVLAHELAHQRSDDLWQHRFFQVNENQDDYQHRVQTTNQLDMQFDKRAINNLQQKEARADHDGLILMSSVGFNPYQVLGKKDFFTEWVESIWQNSCDSQQDAVIFDACQQAKSRALRTYSQLDLVASQSSLYDLGVQALVANQYANARYYFTQYGRDFPNRAVMSALGLSHLAEAIQIRKELIHQGLVKSPDFFYPLILDAAVGIDLLPHADKRASVDKYLEKRQAKISELITQSIDYFEKAIRLQPDYKNSYLSLASAHLLDGNSFMVRGILQGKYIQRFGQDLISDMLLAMTLSIEGKPQQATESLRRIVESKAFENSELSGQPVQDDLVKFSVAYNFSALLNLTGKPDEATVVWKEIAKSAQSSGNAYLFRLALGQLKSTGSYQSAVLKQAPTINGHRLGNKKTRDDTGHSINELWIEGEQFHVYNYNNGIQFITASNGRIISARQQSGSATLANILNIGDDTDRPIKTLGLPDRRINLLAGEYLAYDQYGLALHIDDKKLQGWFLY